MLSERQLQEALKVFEERMQALNEEYLRLMGEHIKDLGKLTATDMHRTVQMKRMNANVEAIKRRIARAMDANIKDVEQVFLAAAESDAKFAAAIFGETHSPTIKGNKPLERILKAQLRITGQSMQNLSQTTIRSELYRKAVDVGVTAVQAGLTDYNSAVRRAIREAASEGLRVKYPNSGLTRRLDTAVRQNILDGVRSINQDVLNQLGKEFGADGVELDAHALCAEDHLPYQGRQFSNKEFADLQNRLERKIGAWNCKHTCRLPRPARGRRSYAAANLRFATASRALCALPPPPHPAGHQPAHVQRCRVGRLSEEQPAGDRDRRAHADALRVDAGATPPGDPGALSEGHRHRGQGQRRRRAPARGPGQDQRPESAVRARQHEGRPDPTARADERQRIPEGKDAWGIKRPRVIAKIAKSCYNSIKRGYYGANRQSD